MICYVQNPSITAQQNLSSNQTFVMKHVLDY